MSNQFYIELTSQGVKGVILERKGDGSFFKQVHWHSFATGWDGLNEPNLIASWIKSWISPGSKTTLIIPRHLVLSRTLTLPSDDPSELKRMVALQIGEHIPYALDEVVWDISLINAVNGFSTVMVWVVQQKDLLRWIDPLVQAGIKFENVTLNISGLMAQIKKLNLPKIKHKWHLLLVVDVSSTECVFINEEQSICVRSLDIGFKDLQEPLEIFQSELILTMKDFIKDHNKEDVAFVSVMASKALPLWFEEWCKRQSLQYQFIESNLVSRDKKCLLPSHITSEGVSLASINGLAQADKKNILSLMPTVFKKREEESLKRSLLIQVSILFLLGLFLIVLTWQMPIIQAHLQIERLKAVVVKQQNEVRKIEQIRKQLEEFKKFHAGTLSFGRIAEAIEDGLGGNVFLNTMTINNDHVLVLEGYGREGVDLDAVQSKLLASNILKEVNLDYVNKRVTQEGQWVYFRMTMSIKSKEE